MKGSKLHAEILGQLDIAAEAVAVGVEFVAQSPSADGWLACRAVGRADRNPSAAINVGPGRMRGMYRDLGDTTGRACDFFGLAVRAGRFPNRDSALHYYASKVGMDLRAGSDGKKTQLTEQVVWLADAEDDGRLRQLWCTKKSGIIPETLSSFGARKCVWPRRHDSANSHICWALPGRLPGSQAPAALLLYKADGENFPSVRNLPVRKTHLVRGSRDSWLWPGDDSILQQGQVLLKTEGPSDAMAIWPLLPEGWVVLTNLAGAAANPGRLPMGFAANKFVVVVGDADKTGQAGARRFAEAFAKHARQVRLVELPYKVTESHGLDMRDWLIDGHTFADFQALLSTATVVSARTAPENSAGQR